MLHHKLHHIIPRQQQNKAAKQTWLANIDHYMHSKLLDMKSHIKQAYASLSSKQDHITDAWAFLMHDLPFTYLTPTQYLWHYA